jgi:nucleoside-diphosphate-sugar epimerase
VTTIAVLGANGVYGRHLVPRLAARGYQIRGLVRRPEKATAFAPLGVEMRAADIFDARSLRSGLQGCDIAVNLATAVPRPGAAADFAMNDRLRRQGAPILVEACVAAGVGRLLQQSIAMVHSGTVADEGWADETSPVLATASAVDMEKAITQSRLDWIILRGGLFYGPGTGHEDQWRAEARAGTLTMPGDGQSFVSLVHVADMAAATVMALEKWPSRQVMLVTDDQPVRWRELFTYVAAIEGGLPPRGGGPPRASFRVCNRKARETLGWRPAYGDFRAGLAT